MKYSIGNYIDNKLQKQIKCFDKELAKEYKLKEIYESMYDDPATSLNKIRKNIELLFKKFFEDNNFNETTFPSRLASCNKLSSKSQIVKYYQDKYTNKSDANSKLDLIYSYGNIIRVNGNSGSHSGYIENELFSQKAIISFISFFELYTIFYGQSLPECFHFSNFIYNNLDVIYQTKEDTEEWQKIKYYKFNFQYDLFIGERELVEKRIDLRNLNVGKNIYFLYAYNDTYHRCKKLYKKLDEINENKYFLTNESDPEIEIIDIIPLRLDPINMNHPFKWDLCYINLSIEFENSGIDLILFLIFNKEKFKTIENNLEFNSIL